MIMRFWKATNLTETHNGLAYHDGLVVDPLPFNPSGSCEPGGIYYADEDNISLFLGSAAWVREVTIPPDANIYPDPDGDKVKANKVILGPRVALRVWLRDFVSRSNGHIGGSLNLGGLTSAEGLTLPQRIGGSLDLGGLTSAEGLTLPQSIGGSLYLDGLTSAEGLTLPQS